MLPPARTMERQIGVVTVRLDNGQLGRLGGVGEELIQVHFEWTSNQLDS